MQKRIKKIKKIVWRVFVPSLLLLICLLPSCYTLSVHQVSIVDTLIVDFSKSKIKIVHLSDIHIKSFGNNENAEEIIKTINDLQSDIIVYTGDYGTIEEMRHGLEIFPNLKCKYKKYAILGNHDYGDKEHADQNWKSEEDKKAKENQLKDQYRQWGVELLLNESDTLSFNGHLLAIIGLKVYDPHHRYFDGDIDKAILKVRGIKNKILLIHNPDYWKDEIVGKHDIKLTLAGHTHGGQIGIGFGDYKISPAQLMYSNWKGMYEDNGQILFVNTGLGIYGLPFRIGMDPEIAVVNYSF